MCTVFLLDGHLKILYVPRSIIWHRGGRTRRYTPAAVYRACLSKVLLMRKMLPPGRFYCWRCLYRLYMWALGGRRSAHRLIREGYSAAVPSSYRAVILRALRDAAHGRLDTYSMPFDLRDF